MQQGITVVLLRTSILNQTPIFYQEIPGPSSPNTRSRLPSRHRRDLCIFRIRPATLSLPSWRNCFFLMMDVCFGGTIDPILAKARSVGELEASVDVQFLVKKLTRHTRKFLTSGSKEYVSDGIPGKHSPFAEKFILALRQIGGGSGRILSLIELRTYFLNLASETRFGSFGKDDPASDFVFVAKQ
jgi:hypothetical protein